MVCVSSTDINPNIPARIIHIQMVETVSFRSNSYNMVPIPIKNIKNKIICLQFASHTYYIRYTFIAIVIRIHVINGRQITDDHKQ